VNTPHLQLCTEVRLLKRAIAPVEQDKNNDYRTACRFADCAEMKYRYAASIPGSDQAQLLG
jgi:hypothetical protein